MFKKKLFSINKKLWYKKFKIYENKNLGFNCNDVSYKIITFKNSEINVVHNYMHLYTILVVSKLVLV